MKPYTRFVVFLIAFLVLLTTTGGFECDNTKSIGTYLVIANGCLLIMLLMAYVPIKRK